MPQDYSIFRYYKTEKETQAHLYIILYVIRDAKPISIFWQSILVCFADKNDLVKGLICSTKGVIRILKNRQHNGQKKKNQQRSTKHTHKIEDRVTRIPLKTGGGIRGSVRGIFALTGESFFLVMGIFGG
jgi:hypothetical protein